MKRLKLLIAAFVTFISISTIQGQNSEKDPISVAQAGVMDMNTSSELEYNQRIKVAAQRFKDLIRLVSQRGDIGDFKPVATAYHAFVNLLSKADRLDDIDKWNRNFIATIRSNDPLRINYILMMSSAYKESNDIDISTSITSLDYHGESTKALAFLTEYGPKNLGDYDHARLLAVRGDLELYGRNIKAARQTFNDAYRLLVKAKGDNSPEAFLFRMFQEIAAAYDKDYSNALSIAKEIKTSMDNFKRHYASLRKEVYGRDFVEYPSLLSRMASYSKLMGNGSDEMKYNKDALDAAYDNYGSTLHILIPMSHESLPIYGPEVLLSSDLQDIKLSLANCLLTAGNNDEAKRLLKEILKDYMNKINKTSDYSKIDLESIKKEVNPLIALAPICAALFPNDQDFCQISFNSSLLYKNFSIFTEHLILDLVNKDNDPEIKNLYNEIVLLNKQLDKAESAEAMNIQQKIRQKNEQLLVDLDFSTVGTMLKTDWQTVQDYLTSSSIAVEFIYTKNEQGRTLYLASVLRSDGKPEIIPLFDEEKLRNIIEPYSSSDAYNCVWKPILSKYSGIKNIFFSPTGLLHNIGIEYLSNDEGVIVNQIYNIYRLSSTRELVTAGKRKTMAGATIVYGGIKYDEKKVNSNLQTEVLALNDEQKRILRSGGGFDYLPQTLEEMKNVASVLSSKYKVTTISGIDGTEESFKSLSGKAMDVIHVATHGFYVPKYRKSIISTATKNPFNSLEDQSLSRSGLLMAGAGKSLDGKMTQGDDGILTAKEIARLDLSKVDLIVLSACETGLGDISGEGVFGLQRGLKKAGVKSLLMSLWKVDDEATQILMSEFYKNIISGKTKVEAFKEAQVYLRSTQGGKFNNAKYWAAFILLDAL